MLEITLRTPNALEVIQVLAQQVPEAVIAAGTITTPSQWASAYRAGARFGVSPGLTPALIEAAEHMGMPLLPGVATATELMTALSAGFECFKFSRRSKPAGWACSRPLAGPSQMRCSAPRAGSRQRRPPTTWRCPMWPASEAHGWRPRRPCRRVTGARSKRWPGKLARCHALADIPTH